MKPLKLIGISMTFTIIVLLATASLGIAGPKIKQVCLQLNHDLVGLSPFQYHLSFLSAKKKRFLITGSSYVTLITNPLDEIERVVTGGAAVIDDVLEVSLNTTDIRDNPITEQIEALAISDIHMLLDPKTYEGTFQSVNVHYPIDDGDGTPNFGSLSGVVERIKCP